MTKAKKMSKYELNQYNAENNLILSILGPLIPNPQPPPVAEVAEPVDSSRGEKSSGDEAVDPAVVAARNKLCHNFAKGCKRKILQEGCLSNYCFNCCFDSGKDCIIHMNMRQKREEDDRLIEEYGNGNKKAKKETKFYHFEERFMKAGDTVVIWCFKDFYRNKAFSGELFRDLERQRSRELSLLKRRSGGDLSSLANGRSRKGKAEEWKKGNENAISSSSSSSSTGGTGGSNSGSKRKGNSSSHSSSSSSDSKISVAKRRKMSRSKHHQALFDAVLERYKHL